MLVALLALLACVSGIIIDEKPIAVDYLGNQGMGMPPFAVLAPTTLRSGHQGRMTVMLFQEIEGELTMEYYNHTVTYYPSRFERKDVISTSSAMVKKADRQVEFDLQIPEYINGYHYVKLSLNIEGFGKHTYPEQRLTVSGEGYKTFVQTDKPVYKPGELVRFRAFTVDMNLRPLLETKGIKMRISNPSGIVLMDEYVTADDQTVHQGQFVLAEEAAIGKYSISAGGKGRAYCDFSVEEYVLPKFGVEITSPGHITSDDTDIEGSVSATYTYGKPVNGKLKMTFAVDSASQPLHSGSYLFHELSMDFVEGKADWKISVAALKTKLKYLINPFCDPTSLIITAQVTDDAKGFNVEARDDSTKFVQSSYKLSFNKNTHRNYVAGMEYYVELDVTSLAEDVSDGMMVQITMAGNISDTSYTTVSVPVVEGKARHVFNVPDSTCSVKITAEMSTESACDKVYACYQPERMVSKHSEFIRFTPPSEGPVSYKVGDTATFTFMTKGLTQSMLEYHYIVITKGMVVKSGTLKELSVNQNTVNFSFEITSAINVRSRMLVFTASEKTGYIIADAADICIIESIDNSVDITLSKSQGEPGENISLYFDTAPNSFIGISVVDASLNLLKKPCKSLSKDSALEFSRGLDKGSDKDLSCVRDDPYQCTSSTEVKITDSVTLVRTQGVNLQTNMKMFSYKPPAKPVQNKYYGGRTEYAMMESNDMMYMSSSSEPEALRSKVVDDSPAPVPEEEEEGPRLRNVFPEAWLWTDVITGKDGKYELTAKVPDTITGWIGTAFGLSKEQGLGFSNEVNFKTFLPFFCSLDLPYSGTVGERLKVKVRVYNYLDTQTIARVKVTSEEWETLEQTVKVGANKAVTVEYPVSLTTAGNHLIKVEAFSSGGKSDAVEKRLLVKPGGERIIESHNILMMEKKTATKKRFIDIKLPTSFIPGSHMLRLVAVGDILGEAVTGVSNLIQLPSGCGEQNMHKIAINVFAANYVKAMYGELPENLQINIAHHLNTGLQQQMAYRLGSSSSSQGYSVFRGGETSTWLSVFVYKILSQFPADIYLPCPTIKADFNSLIYKISNEYRSTISSVSRSGWAPAQYSYGDNRDLYWNSYYLIGMLESEGANRCDQRINGSSWHQERITRVCNGTLDMYIESKTDCCYDYMVKYALELCNTLEPTFYTRRDPENKRELKADKCLSTSKYNKDRHVKCGDYANLAASIKANSRVVESTAYAALYYMYKKDVKSTVPLILWLVNQRSDRGGFRSSQDTVIGLQALSTFAKLTGAHQAKKTDLAITVGKGKSYSNKLSVSEDNKLTTQEVILKPGTGQYKVKWSGKGVAFVQLISTFHVSEVNYKPIFKLTATARRDNKGMLYLNIGFKLRPQKGTMYMLDISAVTGAVFRQALIEGEYQQTDSNFNIITRYDVKEGGQRLLLYIDPMASDILQGIRVPFEQTFDVEDRAEAQVTLVDYYDPSKRETIFYSFNPRPLE